MEKMKKRELITIALVSLMLLSVFAATPVSAGLVYPSSMVSSVEQPDLTWVGAITFDPEYPNVGDTVWIRKTWSNIGRATAPFGYDIRVEILKDGVVVSDERFTGQQPMAPDEERIFSYRTSYNFPSAGKYQIRLTLDSTDAVEESNENNNIQVDDITTQGFKEIPEFTTIAIPVATALGLMFLISRKKGRI